MYANHPIHMLDNRHACLFFLATDEIFLIYRHFLSLSVIVKSGTERWCLFDLIKISCAYNYQLYTLVFSAIFCSINSIWDFFLLPPCPVACLARVDTDYSRQTGSTVWQCDSSHTYHSIIYMLHWRWRISSRITLGMWVIQYVATGIPCSVYVVK